MADGRPQLPASAGQALQLADNELPTTMASAFLTRREKLRELEQWFAILGTRRWQRDVRGRSGRGQPDADMVPWCLRLNGIPGICTLQSCAGHRFTRDRCDPGNLWLRLDRSLYAAVFPHRLAKLVAVAGVERVQMLRAMDGRRIVAIQFAGNGQDRLARSMRGIVGFFERIDRERRGAHD